MVKAEGRALVEGDQHIICTTHKAVGTARTEITTVNSAGMTGEFAQVGSRVPHHSTNQSRLIIAAFVNVIPATTISTNSNSLALTIPHNVANGHSNTVKLGLITRIL